MSAEETTKKPEEGTTPAEEKEGTAKEEESTAHFEPVVSSLCSWMFIFSSRYNCVYFSGTAELKLSRYQTVH